MRENCSSSSNAAESRNLHHVLQTLIRVYRGRRSTTSEEMGERRPKESEQSGEVVKVVIGIDPDRV
jgi:hypothetical protein